MNTGVSAKAGRREAVSTSGWRQGVRKRDSLSEENKGDPTPCCFSEGLPTPPKAVTAMGRKLVSDGGVKAQLALELILSCSFCFPSRPCGDTAGQDISATAAAAAPAGVCSPFPLLWCCSMGILVFPSMSQSISPGQKRGRNLSW